ncbi:hypothetical protein C0991_000902 [Blastosporella zonata]|nr:hypothetical protein C0991_000902 [Blastosporella zonata]
MNSVKSQMELGSAPPSMTTHALEKREQFGLSDVEMAYALSSPWSAGVGTTVSAIEVAISDPELFPEPSKFKPERFLDPHTKGYKLAFGYGRRICPGMHIAQQAMFITLSRLLWAFDILPVSENGKLNIPSADDFTSGLISRPANLKYRLVPRHKGVVDLIMLDAEKADLDALAWQ